MTEGAAPKSGVLSFEPFPRFVNDSPGEPSPLIASVQETKVR
jgi:hypothetical protein